MLPRLSSQEHGVGDPTRTANTPSGHNAKEYIPRDHSSDVRDSPQQSSFTLRSSIDKSSQSEDLKDPTARQVESRNDETQTIILKSFSPRVAVYTSPDTDELVRLKGLYGGLCGILRPFGENVQGKVIIRDSAGASRSWSNFGIHFCNFRPTDKFTLSADYRVNNNSNTLSVEGGTQEAQNPAAALIAQATPIDRVVQYAMRHEHQSSSGEGLSEQILSAQALSSSSSTEYFSCFLRKALSGRSMVPHDTFTHPVACVIAISSQNKTPIETLRDLYNDTRQESEAVPSWVAGDFLRYYVLVHDEDHDDIARSTSLFNQMKRHFGLHCHLLRLRSVQCTPEDPDGSTLPACQWLSAEEEVFEIAQQENNLDTGHLKQYLFDSDATVIKTFVREMVTQSILPFMEGRVTNWNDQVASRRRGISGRFMSLSKRWAGFSAGKNAKGNTNGSNSGGNYDTKIGAYGADVPESVMHRLADYAFMLRDWKLSSSIYDIMRLDFADDKAWKHHAAVSEMLAMSFLLGSQSNSPRAKAETIDQTLDAATYSYITRCADPSGAARCLLVAIELYCLQRDFSGEAAKWTERLLELSLLTPLAQTLLVERLVRCYQSYGGIGYSRWVRRNRKASMWLFMSSHLWLLLDEPILAELRFKDASQSYDTLGRTDGIPHFKGMVEYWEQSKRSITKKGQDVTNSPPGQASDDTTIDDQEGFTNRTSSGRRQQRFSLGSKPQEDVIGLLQKLQVPIEKQDDGFAYDSSSNLE